MTAAALPSKVYRVTRPQFARTADEAFSGEGGLHDDGRWHEKGSPVLYTSDSSTLCMMERLVHADELFTDQRPDRVLLAIDLPAISFVRITAAQLAARDGDWRAEGSLICRNLGASWIETGVSCALVVPSAVNPLATNIILNPAHREYGAIVEANRALVFEPLHPDRRLAPFVAQRRQTSHG